uniref:Xylulose kinase-1 n=1 Tax=Tanacetum cinerariifolium TaxID=118510 RepID=A0A6L2LHL7_TANCI|nr:hypothetical protein [Tanacetum cinerariifolium]
MSTPTFADTHNIIAFLEKPAESAEFEQIIDFLKSKPIHYVLTVNPTIYVSCVKQFWATAKVKGVNDQEHIQALVDKKKVIITEDNIMSDLCFDDAEGTACLINEAIFDGLTHMGAKTTAWNKFGSTMASTIICLADNQKFNFSKPQKKQKPRRKQRKEAEVSHDESVDEDHVPIPSSALLPNARRVKSHLEMDSLGAQEDVSKQGRMIEEIDQDDKIALDADTQGKKNDDEMFGVDDLSGEEVVFDTTTGEHEEQIIKDVSTVELVTTAGEVVTTVANKVSAAPTTHVTKDEITMAQALAALKGTKPKVVVQEQEDNTQAMMKANSLLAKRIQSREKEEFSKVQKARLLVELIEKRKKHFAALRAQEKRNKPPTKAQMRGQMCTYLRNMGGYKHSHLKGRSYDEIKKLFDKEMRKVDENVEPVIDDTEKLNKCMEIVPDDGDKGIVKDRFKKEKPMDDMDNLLFRTLKTMFEHHVEDVI